MTYGYHLYQRHSYNSDALHYAPHFITGEIAATATTVVLLFCILIAY